MGLRHRFDVDVLGLRKLLEDRGKAFALLELIQNALDAPGVTRVDVRLRAVPKRPLAVLEVEDDSPDGFKDLSHAWTLFAESEKKGDPTKRGRWNLGEKLVIALCDVATIATTTGTVTFDQEGRHMLRAKREAGSMFSGTMKMTHEEVEEALREVRALIPPVGILVTLNGEPLPATAPLASFHVTLPTVISDGEGVLRKTARATLVTVHAVRDGDVPKLYELGIPVVATDMPWHVNVHQKVPLNTDRDNVTPAYLRAVHVAVLNAMHEHVKGEAMASAAWARDASASKDVTADALGKVLDERFGAKRVGYDPKDVEGSHIAVAKGYTVVHGGSLSAGEWDRAKELGLIKPAGQVTPSPKPFSPEGRPLKVIDPENYTPAMRCRLAFAVRYARHLLDAPILTEVADDPGWPFVAAYGPHSLILNAAALGAAWWEQPHDHEEVTALLIHEFAHHFEANHLSEKFHKACCRLGAKSTRLALTKPDVFR